MTLFPKKFSNPAGGVYDLNDNYIQPIGNSFKGTGADGSELEYSLFIGSAVTERVVSFKAFLESYKYNLQKASEDNTSSMREQVFYTDKSSNLSISLTLNIPAHSVNESRNNVAKIEELQRLILVGNWSSGVNVSPKTNIVVPVMLVHFRNLISNSRKVSSLSIKSFEDLLKKGFPCYIKDVSYTPDTSAGFFEFDKFLHPKNLTLSLELVYESESLWSEFDPNRDKVVMEGFSERGEYSEVEDTFSSGRGVPSSAVATGTSVSPIAPKFIRTDGGASPFHSYSYKDADGKSYSMTIRAMNNFNLSAASGFADTGKKSDSFVFIGLPPLEGQNLEKTFTNGINSKVLENKKVLRHVFLEMFLESHERKITPSYKVDNESANSSVYSRIESQVTKELTYNFKLNMPADSLLQAKQNCAKIQYMCRMFIKRYVKSPTLNSSDGTYDFKQVSNLCKVYSPSFIESAGSPKGQSRNVQKILDEYSIDLYWSSFSFDVQMESGFFNEDGFLYPKVITVDLGFKTHEPYIAAYNFSTPDAKNPNWKLAAGTSNSARTSRNSYLFPFNRKTVKI